MTRTIGPNLDRFRAMALAAMPDEGTVTRPGEGGTLNTTTGVFVPNAPTTVYTGRCRIMRPTTAEQEALFGETQVTTQRWVGVFPHDSAPFAIDDTVTLSASSDPQLVGFPLRVTAIARGSWHVDRRVGLEVQQ